MSLTFGNGPLAARPAGVARTRIVLVRHGETAWSRSGQHTSRTDLELTDRGEAQARSLGAALAGQRFDLVLTSPSRRAAETARLAGFADREVAGELREWDYGEYEGRTTPEIREDVPGWTVWDHPSPGGESAADVGARVDRLLDGLPGDGAVALFSHGHLLRVLAARWLGLPPSGGALLRLDTATVSELGYERERRVVVRWNVG